MKFFTFIHHIPPILTTAWNLIIFNGGEVADVLARLPDNFRIMNKKSTHLTTAERCVPTTGAALKFLVWSSPRIEAPREWGVGGIVEKRNVYRPTYDY